jgi:hypothetical protein
MGAFPQHGFQALYRKATSAPAGRSHLEREQLDEAGFIVLICTNPKLDAIMTVFLFTPSGVCVYQNRLFEFV